MAWVKIPKLSGLIGIMDPALTNTGVSDKVKLLLISTVPWINSPVDQLTKYP